MEEDFEIVATDSLSIQLSSPSYIELKILAPTNSNPYFVRFKELFRNFTELSETKAKIMACELTVHWYRARHLVLIISGNLSILLNS
jgi:hypothetical protein